MTVWSEQQRAIFGWVKFNALRDTSASVQRRLEVQAPPASQHLVVRARAGTGKTTTLIQAVQEIGAPANEVLVCAFNKRIQLELEKKLGTAAQCMTLHALGYKYLRGAWGSGLTVESEVEDDRIAKACNAPPLPPWEVVLGLKKLIGIAKGAAPFGTVEELTELCIDHGCDNEAFPQYDSPWLARVARGAMDEAKNPDPMGRITFDDMLYVTVASGFAIPMYKWVVVDECQDMNTAQLILAQKALLPDGHMVLVGDDRQAIYGFRGADSNAVDRLKHELQADELGLNTTYRCPRSVVKKAQEIVEDFFHAPDAPEGIVSEIGMAALLTAAKPGDVILSRVNAPLVPLCLSLIRKSIRARIEGRDVGKLLADRARKLHAVTVEEFMAKLSKWAQTASARVIARGKAVDSRLQQIRDVEETLAALAEDAPSVETILQRCERLFADVAGQNDAAQYVVLSSVHKAKGLEWQRVFLLSDTLYCFGLHPEDREEQNIAYVAITRAKGELTLVRGAHG